MLFAQDLFFVLVSETAASRLFGIGGRTLANATAAYEYLRL